MKIKYLRANQAKFITKDLHKEITKCSRLRYTFLRDRKKTSRKEYKNTEKKSKNSISQVLI